MNHPVRNRLVPYLNAFLGCAVLPAAVIGLIMLRSNVTSMEYRIGALEHQRVAALTEQKGLEADLSSLKARSRVDENQLALTDPDRRKVFIVKRDTSAVPQAASFRRRN